MSAADNDECLTMIEDCENRESKLTDWERSFIDSVKSRLTAGNSLTERQAETLENIWNRIT